MWLYYIMFFMLLLSVIVYIVVGNTFNEQEKKHLFINKCYD